MILADVDDKKLLLSYLPVSGHHEHTAGKDTTTGSGVSGGGEQIDEQKLKSFVQSAARAHIRHITYSTQRDKAVIDFLSTPG